MEGCSESKVCARAVSEERLTFDGFSLLPMGGDKSVEAALDLSGPIAEGKRREDGYWANLKGVALPVSASDLERHTYCPVSWQLSKAGVSGEGEAIEKGMIAHDQIHKKMQEFKRSEDGASRAVSYTHLRAHET